MIEKFQEFIVLVKKLDKLMDSDLGESVRYHLLFDHPDYGLNKLREFEIEGVLEIDTDCIDDRGYQDEIIDYMRRIRDAMYEAENLLKALQEVERKSAEF